MQDTRATKRQAQRERRSVVFMIAAAATIVCPGAGALSTPPAYLPHRPKPAPAPPAGLVERRLRGGHVPRQQGLEIQHLAGYSVAGLHLPRLMKVAPRGGGI